MDATTPLYWSKYESKINAFVPSFKSCGGFILSITASNNKLTFSPVLPLTGIISSSLKPRTLTNSAVTFGTSAFGKSILFITGIIVKLWFRAKYRFARVWASIPWVASTTRIAPSQAAKLLDTSYEIN